MILKWRAPLAGLSTVCVLAACGDSEPAATMEKSGSEGELAVSANFVGSQSCSECHAEETKDWHQSDHHLAMQPANSDTVLGNFNDESFTHFEVETKLFKKGDKFFVKTPDSEGKPTEYEIKYTFGHYPLQQYLIPFPGGRYQALSICWDSRPKEEGGQRWFHLYPDEKIPSDDILHWTRQHFNWNYMCADCHSTNLKKNYDIESKTYSTTWSEMNVSCEACHGPGSRHNEWARMSDSDKAASSFQDMGLTVLLKEKDPGIWIPDPETGKPKRSKALASNIQVESCARCHARRRVLEKEFRHGQKSFADAHRPSILEDLLYHPDGQIKEEVYVYGSFVQSKMYHQGVRCTDCHNPHTLKLKYPGNALCAQCHQPSTYDTTAHHFHEPGSTGASCVECHMPETHYMVVDPRRDHSIRIPRPDLSVSIGVPNACNQCHEDKENEWAADALKKWLTEAGKPALPAHYGEVIAAGRQNETGSELRLVTLALDQKAPGIARATAISILGRRPTELSIQASVAALTDSDPAARESALTSLEAVNIQERVQMTGKLLGDPVRAVRIEAARILAAAIPQGLLGPNERKTFDRALAEYIAFLNVVADRPGSHVAFGLLYTNLGDPVRAEKAYRRAFEVDPDHAPSRVNLAELIRQQGREPEARKLLLEAVALQPENGLMHEALGRHWIQVKDYGRGLESLGNAARLDPDRAAIQFFYGVALNQLGDFKLALPFLQRANELEPDNPEYLAGLATICRDHSEWDLALKYAQDAVVRFPEQPGYQQLLEEIEARRKQ